MDQIIEDALKRYPYKDALGKYIKEKLGEMADIDTMSAWEWIRDEFSNMSVSEIDEMLDAVARVHDGAIMGWVNNNCQCNNPDCEDHDIGWA